MSPCRCAVFENGSLRLCNAHAKELDDWLPNCPTCGRTALGITSPMNLDAPMKLDPCGCPIPEDTP